MSNSIIPTKIEQDKFPPANSAFPAFVIDNANAILIHPAWATWVQLHWEIITMESGGLAEKGAVRVAAEQGRN